MISSSRRIAGSSSAGRNPPGTLIERANPGPTATVVPDSPEVVTLKTVCGVVTKPSAGSDHTRTAPSSAAVTRVSSSANSAPETMLPCGRVPISDQSAVS